MLSSTSASPNGAIGDDMPGPRLMDHDDYSNDYIRNILREHKVIAMVGASPNPIRPSYFAMKYLKQKGFRVIPVNPGQARLK